jgi:hypothetical protein
MPLDAQFWLRTAQIQSGEPPHEPGQSFKHNPANVSDLLPPSFDNKVGWTTGRPLLSIERESVWVALLNTVRCSLLRKAYAHDADLTPLGTTMYGSHVRLETDDHLSSPMMSRSEMAERIVLSSGLDYVLSRYAIVLLEKSILGLYMRQHNLDSALPSREHQGLQIGGLGCFLIDSNIDFSAQASGLGRTITNYREFMIRYYVNFESFFRQQDGVSSLSFEEVHFSTRSVHK